MSFLVIVVVLQTTILIWFMRQCARYRQYIDRMRAMLEDGEMARITTNEDPVLMMRLRLDQDR